MRIKEREREVAVEKIGNPNGIFLNICGAGRFKQDPSQTCPEGRGKFLHPPPHHLYVSRQVGSKLPSLIATASNGWLTKKPSVERDHNMGIGSTQYRGKLLNDQQAILHHKLAGIPAVPTSQMWRSTLGWMWGHPRITFRSRHTIPLTVIPMSWWNRPRRNQTTTLLASRF